MKEIGLNKTEAGITVVYYRALRVVLKFASRPTPSALILGVENGDPFPGAFPPLLCHFSTSSVDQVVLASLRGLGVREIPGAPVPEDSRPAWYNGLNGR